MSDKLITTGLLDRVIKDVAPRDGSFEVTRLSDPKSLCVVDDWLSAGCLPINLITGGGFPMGRITEVFGDSSTGKSLMATHAVIEAQARDFLTVFIDTESAISVPLMEQLGVDTDLLVYLTPNTVEQVFETLEKILDSKDKNKDLGVDHPALVVWDTVAATSTKDEMETIKAKGLEQKQFSSAAIQISRALRAGWARRFARSNVCAVFVNQIRERVGVMFGDKTGTFGGKAISFYATLRLALTTKGAIKSAGEVVGIRAQVYTKKNKVFPPFRKIEVPIIFGYGIDEAEATLDMLESLKLVRKSSGGWYTISLGDEELRFQKPGWVEQDGIFDTNYTAVEAMLKEAYK